MYSVLFISIIFIFINIKQTKREQVFFILLLFTIFYNSLLSILNDGLSIGILNSLKIVKNYYLVVLIGFILYKFYYLSDKIENFYKLIIKIGLFIAIFNFLLSIDNYLHIINFASSIREYIDIHHSNYSQYIRSSVGLLRPAGYFFDLHSQTFIPMAALFLLLLRVTTIKYQKLVILILIFSILMSSIRMSYAMLVVFGLFILLMKKQKISFWILLTIFLISFFGYFSEYIIMFFDQIRGLRGNTSNIAANHLITIPFLLWDESIITFFFGGNSTLRSVIYSEVYLWTLLFYIGLFGLIFYFIPLFTLLNFKKYKVGFFFSLYMLVSLLHYKVYNQGINVFVSSIGFIYMFDLLHKIKGKK